MTENNNEEQTSETAEEAEKPDTSAEESTEESTEKKQEVEEKIEPPKRFPKQTNEEKEEGYWSRQAKILKEENEKLKAQTFEGSYENTGLESLEDGEDAPLTRKELDAILAQKDRETTSERMVNDFINENPDYKKIEQKLRVYIKDPDYANIPIGFIASGIIGEDIDSEANKRAMEKINADKEAAKTKTGGSTKRGIPGKKQDIWGMSSEEFSNYQSEVLQRNRG
jgi:hypothetical protein